MGHLVTRFSNTPKNILPEIVDPALRDCEISHAFLKGPVHEVATPVYDANGGAAGKGR